MSHEIGNRASRRGHNRETVRERLGDGHAVGLAEGCEHEDIRSVVERGQFGRIHIAGEEDVLVQPSGAHQRSNPFGRRRVPIDAARACQPPVAV